MNWNPRVTPPVARPHWFKSMGAGLISGADQRGKYHQGRWRPRGPRNGLFVRPAPPLVGTHLRGELGWYPAHQNVGSSSRLGLRDSPIVGIPPDPQPTHRLWLRGTSVFTGKVTQRRAAPSQAKKTATAGEVSMITEESRLHGPLFLTTFVSRLELCFKL